MSKKKQLVICSRAGQCTNPYCHKRYPQTGSCAPSDKRVWCRYVDAKIRMVPYTQSRNTGTKATKVTRYVNRLVDQAHKAHKAMKRDDENRKAKKPLVVCSYARHCRDAFCFKRHPHTNETETVKQTWCKEIRAHVRPILYTAPLKRGEKVICSHSSRCTIECTHHYPHEAGERCNLPCQHLNQDYLDTEVHCTPIKTQPQNKEAKKPGKEEPKPTSTPHQTSKSRCTRYKEEP